MPWAIRTENGQHCVYKKTTGKTLHCYDDEGKAKDYLAALYANAHEKELSETFIISKQDDGRYHIVAVSTAALKDREGETFTTDAMDYDINMAETSGEYPEFRLFHQKGLGFGKVTKMRRVGIFAVDEGYSYDDTFSISVCEKMLVPNPGKWRASRGFYIIETSGGCPSCGTSLLVGTKHMKVGFKCPGCDSVFLDYKGVLSDVHFRKAKTFDVTVTDQPAVPWTGVAAFRSQSEDNFMNKKELKQRLLNAGLDEGVVNSRLDALTDTQLKEYDDIPFAEVLKEFGEDEDALVDVDELVKELTEKLTETVKTTVKELLDGFTVNVEDLGELEVDMKEVGEIIALKESVESLTKDVASMKEMLEKLLEKDESRLKELVDDMPRAGKLRIRRFKSPKPSKDEETDDEEGMGDEEENKEFDTGIIADSTGKTYASMTEMLTAR